MNHFITDGRSIFVTGATGYVGGRLVPALLRAGYRVRCLAREPRKLQERPWRSDPRVDVVQGDLSDVQELARQLRGFPVAYFLVHSMEASGSQYVERDRLLALNFARAAKIAGVNRIIYLGGLGELGDGLSHHLRSRREVEETLGSTGIQVTALRAAMIIGSGSASFEILRYLVERLPIMVTPSWVTTESQPVAISDVLHWMVRCLEVPETAGKTLEIGGPDVLPYRELMRVMAEELHIPKRWIVPVPILTPRLSSLWISLVTPVSYKIARPLAEGLRNRVVVTDDTTQRFMPHRALGVREAIQRALQKIELNDVETRWSVAGPIEGDPHWAGGKVFVDQRSVRIKADPSAVFAAVCRIGGGNGWYAGDVLWRIRGWMDTLVGGPGLRRGRRDSERVEFGETLDFWRVVGIDRDRSLSLLAEMKLPGLAMLNFELEPLEDQRTQLTMTARFRPKGLLGILYWYAVAPLHDFVFGGMLRGIRTVAEKSRVKTADAENASTESVACNPGYGRARLWLGITGVGTLVVVAASLLAFGQSSTLIGAPEATGGSAMLSLLVCVLTYALLHLPFDFLGGYWLPKRYGRSHPTLSQFATILFRGVACHGMMLAAVACLLTVAGAYGGVLGTVCMGMIISGLLLQFRLQFASCVSPLRVVRRSEERTSVGSAPDVFEVQCADEGFTGGIAGVLRPGAILLPRLWREVLGPAGMRVVVERRVLAARTGGWLRGRLVALTFTALGLVFASLMVGSGQLGTSWGTIQLSLWFSLWSFLGLLLLPTWSRKGVVEIDERARADGHSVSLMRTVTERLDRLQDGEPVRPGIVETIFHPVPSVESRLEGPRSHAVIGYWDAARTSIYLSAAGLSLLGRAVHCNCGRPSLWVFLPTD